MSDSVGYTPGFGAEIAVDEIAGIKHQRVKVQIGVDGTATDVNAANPMPITAPSAIPVSGALTDAELRATAVPVSGPLTDAQLRAAAVPISGALTNAELRSAPISVEAYGELIEAIEAMRFAISALTKTIGFALPNALGQPIMEVRQTTGSNLLVNANQSGTWSIGTVTNQTQIGGFAANDQIPAFMHLQADNLRRNITVT
jgi:hypothetical protein